MWDPRGFASRVIVPWVSANQNVLGTSSDPYVSQPLRKPRMEADPGKKVKSPDDWKLLYKVLNEVETKSNTKFTRHRLLQTLRSIRRKLTESTFEFHVPKRISLEQTQAVVNAFLSQGSGGDRGLSVATALFETFGKFFGLYSEVRRHVINASDASTGLTADIECLDDGKLKLAIEVKERNLTLIDVRSAILKARQSSISEFLFNTPRTSPGEKLAIDTLIDKTWASGTNLYRLSIDELIQVGLTLTGEEGRKHFLTNVGEQLNKFNTQPTNRQRWKQLLEGI